MLKKFTVFGLLTMSLVLASIISACLKTDESTPQALTSTQTTANAAAAQHNGYLDYICAKIASGELNKVKSNESILQLKNLTKAYFRTGTNAEMNSFIDQSFERYFTNYSGVEQITPLFGDPALASSVSAIGSLILNYENQTISEFTASASAMLDRATQSQLSNGFASIVGVAQGSYGYWFSITPASCYYSSLPGVQERACGEKCKKLAGLALADLAGAADGAAAGTLLAGVGAGPGAVMGGAIYSGLLALSW